MGKKIGKAVTNNTQKQIKKIQKIQKVEKVQEESKVVEILFNEVEQDYILKNRSLPPATLAKALNTTIIRVQNFLDELPKNVNMFDKVIGKSRDKNDNTRAVVMTPAASEVGDKAPRKTTLDPGCVHRCKE